MAADADEIGAQAFGGKGDLEKALHRVGVQQGGGAPRPEPLCDGSNIDDAAGLVVHQHQRHQHRILPQGGKHRLRGDGAVLFRLQARDLEAPGFQLVQAFAHGVVLYQGGDHVLPPAFHGLRTAENGPVVALGAAGGEHQLSRGAAQRVGNLFAALVQQLFGLPAQGIGGAGIAEALRHGGKCRLRRLRADAGGGGIVQIVHSNSLPLCKESKTAANQAAATTPPPRFAQHLPLRRGGYKENDR